MKFRVVRKSDANDVGVVDLSKVAAVHYNPTTGILEVYGSVGLEPGSCVQYSEEIFTFQIIEKSAGGMIYYADKTALEIVGYYAAT